MVWEGKICIVWRGLLWCSTDMAWLSYGIRWDSTVYGRAWYAAALQSTVWCRFKSTGFYKKEKLKKATLKMSNVGEKAGNPVVMVSKSHGDTRLSSRPAEIQEWIAADAQRGLRPLCSNTGSRVLPFTPVKSSNFRQEDVCETVYYMPLYVPSEHLHLCLCPGCAPLSLFIFLLALHLLIISLFPHAPADGWAHLLQMSFA